MTTLDISSNGLTLLECPGMNAHDDITKTGGRVQQAMRLDLEDGVLQNILRSARSGGKGVNLSLGKTITLNFGNRSKQLTADAQSTPTELYTYDPEASDELRFAALQSHRLALKQAQDNTLGADAALTKLQMSLATVEKEKLSRQTQLAEGANLPSTLSRREPAHMSKAAAMNKHPQSQRLVNGSCPMPGKPSLGAAGSPHLAAAPTSAPPIDAQAQKARAIRVPLIHFLAVRPVSEKYLAQTLRCSTGECKEVLERVGRPYRLDNSKWDLTDKAYRELDVHRFKYPSDDDRQLAVDRAVTAYDRLRLPHNDVLWQRLLPVHERGRGKVLSKLHLREAPKGQKAMTPRINVQATDDTRLGGATPRNDSDTQLDRLAPSDAEPTARSKSSDSTKKSKASEKAVRKSPSMGPINPTKVQKPKGKTSPKIPTDPKKGAKKGAPAKVGIAKSSEFVHDSDEEDEEDMTDALGLAAVSTNQKTAGGGLKQSPASVTSAKPLPQDSSKKSNSSERGKDQKKPTSIKIEETTVSNKSNADNVKGAKDSKKPVSSKVPAKDHSNPRTPNCQPAQKRTPTSSSSSSESKPKASDGTQSSVATSKTLSRQRTTSSPLKPSPLGSSPPANASDMDNDVRPSSASSNSTPLVAQSGGSNQTAPKPRPSAATNGVKSVENTPERSLKRKADDINSNIHNHNVPLTNGLTNGNTNGVKRHKASPISPPTSDSSNSSNSDAKFQQAVEDAQRFKRYYTKYHELYHEVAKLPKDVPNPKFDNLMKMHEKLAKMKENIAKASIV